MKISPAILAARQKQNPFFKSAKRKEKRQIFLFQSGIVQFHINREVSPKLYKRIHSLILPKTSKRNLSVRGYLSQMEGGYNNLENDRVLKEAGIEKPVCGFYTVAFSESNEPLAAWRNYRGNYLTRFERIGW
jgi:hypothetical protein